MDTGHSSPKKFLTCAHLKNVLTRDTKPRLYTDFRCPKPRYSRHFGKSKCLWERGFRREFVRARTSDGKFDRSLASQPASREPKMDRVRPAMLIVALVVDVLIYCCAAQHRLPEERAAREEECQIIRIFIRPELEVYIQNTSEKMRVSARKCMN